MIIFGGKFLNANGQWTTDLGLIYSLNLDIKPVNGLIREIILGRALGFEQDYQDQETLKAAQRLLDEKKEHDIVFVVQNKQIPAHKDVLSTRSSYFSNMFSSGMQEAHQKEIILDEISSKAFEALLEYLYKGTLPMDEYIVMELIRNSEKILLKRLRLHCERKLVNLIKKENVAELYELSKVAGAEDLREAALQFMGNNLSYFADEAAPYLANY